METRTRSKRAQSNPAEDDGAPRPKRGRQQDAVHEEQLDQEDDEDTGRQEALRFSSRPTAEPQPQSQSQSQSQGSQSSIEGRRQLIEASLPDLASQAHQLIKFLGEPEDARRQSWKRRLYLAKRAYFENLRGVFEEPQGFPFIDDEQLDFITFSDDEVLKLGYANLATALDIIERISTGDEVSTLEHLTQLDQFLHKLYRPFQRGGSTEGDVLAISLNIRTLLFMKMFEEEKDTSRTSIKMNKLQELLATCFCDLSVLDGEVDYAKLFSRGPFKPIGLGQDEDLDDQWDGHVGQILGLWKKSGKGNSFLPNLQKAFPESQALEALREAIFTVYGDMRVDMGGVSASQTQPPELYHDAREEVDDLESVVESQPIVRASEPAKSFFTPQTYRALVGDDRPSETQEAVADDSNSAILGPRPASTAPSTMTGVTSSIAPSMPNRQRTALPSRPPASNTPAWIDRDDDDDPFEQDVRTVKKGKAAAVRETLESRPAPPPPAEPSSAMPPPPRPSAPQPASSPPPPSSSNAPPSSAFDMIRSEKKRNKVIESISGQQRVPWSEKDSFTLIDLIAKTHCAWSKIQDNYTHRFEHPRNQQAYRDKARNMKVDFLWTDRVLPPCFDHVKLSSKEVKKLQAVGKNPNRMEKDLDDEGTPINTEIPRSGE